jgi:hypothetical protein
MGIPARKLRVSGLASAPASVGHSTARRVASLTAVSLVAMVIIMPATSGMASAARPARAGESVATTGLARSAPRVGSAQPAGPVGAPDDTDLYVNNASGADCSDSGSGSLTQPFHGIGELVMWVRVLSCVSGCPG